MTTRDTFGRDYPERPASGFGPAGAPGGPGSQWSQGGAGGPTPSPVEQAQQQAGQLTSQAKEQTRSFLDSQRERLADGLGGVAIALRQSSQQFHEQDRGMIAQYTDRVADSVEQASRYLRSTDVNEMVSSVEQYARREPALFLGGALALGFLGARFLKSSSSRRGRYAGQYRAGYAPQTTEFRGGPTPPGVA